MSNSASSPVVHTRIERPDRSVALRYREARADVLAALLPASQLMDPAIKPLTSKRFKFAGPAITVAIERANTFMGSAAIGVAAAGDVIVVAAQGDVSAASWNAVLTMAAIGRNCAAIVVDGAVIGTSTILDIKGRVVCRTSTLSNPSENLLGSVNIPVLCGGVKVFPGDMIVGDLDGVLVVPRAEMESLLLAAEEMTQQRGNDEFFTNATGHKLSDVTGGWQMTKEAGVIWVD